MGQDCEDFHRFGTNDWYSPDDNTCILVNYFPGEHPAFGTAVKLWRDEYPRLYSYYLDKAITLSGAGENTSGGTASSSPARGQGPRGPGPVTGQDCERYHRFGADDWHSPDGSTCVLVNYFPGEHPAFGTAVKLWRDEYPTLYASYLAEARTGIQPARQIPSITWLSTGDSYSAAEGYDEVVESTCARSEAAYGPLAADAMRNDRNWRIAAETFTACPGAVSEQMFNNWLHYVGPNAIERALLFQICGALCAAIPGTTIEVPSLWNQHINSGGSERVDVMLMSFGGNDVGFKSVILDCLDIESFADFATFWTDCDRTEEQLDKYIDSLFEPSQNTGCPSSQGRSTAKEAELRYTCPLLIHGDTYGSLVDLFQHIVDHRLTSNGQLYVIGYPRLLAPYWEWEGDTCQRISKEDADMLGDVANHFDYRMHEAIGPIDRVHFLSLYELYRYGTQREVDPNRKYDGYDPTGGSVPGSHELCGTPPNDRTERSTHRWMNGIRRPPWTLCCSFHPNEHGYRATAAALADLIEKTHPYAYELKDYRNSR